MSWQLEHGSASSRACSCATQAVKEAKDVLGCEVLHTAAWNDHEATIQMLVQTFGANKEAKDKCGRTALHVATVGGHGAAIKMLVGNLGADKDAKDTYWTGKRARRGSGSLKTTPKRGEKCRCENVLNNTNDYFGAWTLTSDSMKIGFPVNLT
jgi:hypothetical protein